MNNVGEQINQVINNLADKLGVAAEKLYPVLIKQAYVDGITTIIGIVITAIVLIKSVKSIVKNADCLDKDEIGSKGAAFIVGVIFAILSGIGAIAYMTEIDSCITAFVNPDWYAINMILDKLKVK